MSTFEEIKARHADDTKSNAFDYSSSQTQECHEQRGELIEIVETLKSLARPIGDVSGPELKPLVLYFKNDRDRDEMIEACKAAMPTARAVKVP